MCRCCSPPTTARSTAKRPPRSTPSGTRPPTCATSSARTCGPRIPMPAFSVAGSQVLRACRRCGLGVPAAARHRGPLLRLSHQAARVPGALPGLVPARRRESRRSDPAGRPAHAAQPRRGDGPEWAAAPASSASSAPTRSCSSPPSAATVWRRCWTGVTFVLLIPFLRAVFGREALPSADASTVERDP